MILKLSRDQKTSQPLLYELSHIKKRQILSSHQKTGDVVQMVKGRHSSFHKIFLSLLLDRASNASCGNVCGVSCGFQFRPTPGLKQCNSQNLSANEATGQNLPANEAAGHPLVNGNKPKK